ncbi:MAG: beta-galactosidase [Roseimicrobium sp.]
MTTRSIHGTLLCFMFVHSVWALELRLTPDGIGIDAGSIGKFSMDYPALLDGAQKPIHKVIEKTIVWKSATLRYEGGGQVGLSLASDGQVVATFATMPGDVKSVELAMQIPIGFNQGGKWKIGDTGAAFPVQKPARPHLFQGNATVSQITNYEGKTLEWTVPGYAFLQLSDNREWQWSIFHWKAFVPLEANKSNFKLSFRALGDGVASKPLVDAFGQSTLSDWPEKVRSLEELKADVSAENAYYDALQPPVRDAFGGIPGSKEKLGLKATGFFHVEMKGARWVLVDPIGNAFFHLGLCGVVPNDDFTLVSGRESAYEWLPKPEGEFASVFRQGQAGTVLSFHLVNQVRKYGVPHSGESYTARMIARLKKWGFNSIGAFSPLDLGPEARKAAQFPTVAHLPLNEWEGIKRVPGIHETFDPFDENTRALIEEKLAAFLPAHAQDPLIIGWFIVNEPIYEQIPVVVPSLPGSQHACKRRFVQWLAEKYKTVDAFRTAWRSDAVSFDALLDVGLAVTTDAAKQDTVAFASFFLDEYLRLVATSVRKHDPNHLLIGSRLQPGTISHEWICRTMGKHLDVMSFNYYTYALDKSFLQRIHEWTGGLPMILSEFFWSSPKDTGLTGGREVNSQLERGLAYRNYVEQAAALGYVVGMEWFTLVDQSVTGRWFSGFDGERANSGLISVTDRPWKAMLSEAMKTNSRIYDVWLGGATPFVWHDARFQTKP